MAQLPQLIMEYFHLSEKDLQVDVELVRRLWGHRLLPPPVVAEGSLRVSDSGVNIKEVDMKEAMGEFLSNRRPGEGNPSSAPARPISVLGP